MPTLKDLSIEELRDLIAQIVEEKLQELIFDPDEGLSLRPEVEQRLIKSLNQPEEARQTISAKDVAGRLDVEW